MVDLSEDHAWGNGMDRSVCEGCPHNGRVLKGTMDGCTICGCPFATLVPLGAPPESCPRLQEHARVSGNDDSGGYDGGGAFR